MRPKTPASRTETRGERLDLSALQWATDAFDAVMGPGRGSRLDLLFQTQPPGRAGRPGAAAPAPRRTGASRVARGRAPVRAFSL